MFFFSMEQVAIIVVIQFPPRLKKKKVEQTSEVKITHERTLAKRELGTESTHYIWQFIQICPHLPEISSSNLHLLVSASFEHMKMFLGNSLASIQNFGWDVKRSQVGMKLCSQSDGQFIQWLCLNETPDQKTPISSVTLSYETPDQKTPFFTAFHVSFLIHLPSNPEHKSHAVSFLEVTSVFVTIPVP